MAKEKSYAGKLGTWQRLLEPLTANTAGVPHLEVPRNQLATLLARAIVVSKDQAEHKAAKQDLSKDSRISWWKGNGWPISCG